MTESPYGSDFEAGDVVGFCGEEGTVVRNYGRDGIVDCYGDRVKWSWIFGGEKVQLIRKAVKPIPAEDSPEDGA